LHYCNSAKIAKKIGDIDVLCDLKETVKAHISHRWNVPTYKGGVTFSRRIGTILAGYSFRCH